ncbi:helix-turn-helix transcriptional regulator [Natribacillus halophilus]|uniref:Predicted DNA-binding transcriptional regulator YafY, contains an HTH and WYL domains n=1 Tax=Natribacillus halophilus TaxID=549003 RepID=A0A1G8N3N2_9BACI|nr:transcriptional regulator [Natribacillus halophilus]SDI74725.1 Predicted DNA-binding transcriptional regulator YafY, contains an HTH and WYL domains [Natribacillus halophilus]
MTDPSYSREFLKTERLLTIIRLLQEQATITARELAEYCHTTVRTIYRDMKEIEGLGIQYISEGKHGYRLLQNPGSPYRYLSKEEWLALTVYPQMSQEITKREHPFHQAYRSGVEKMKSMIHDRDAGDVTTLRQELGNRIRFHDQAGDKDTNDVMPALFQAITENQVLEIEYYAIYRDQVTIRSIHPYYIIPRSGHLYVIGYCASREDYRVFRLNRIHSAHVLADTFTIAEDFDIEEYLSARWSIFADDEEETTFVVRFNEDIARYVQEFNFYADTELITEEEGSLLLTTTLQSKKEFVRWVRSFGLDAELLEPQYIREELYHFHKRQSERYQKFFSDP